jgi:hypothetical protein
MNNDDNNMTLVSDILRINLEMIMKTTIIQKVQAACPRINTGYTESMRRNEPLRLLTCLLI